MMDNVHKLPLKQWAKEDRPREKMIAQGKKALSKAELLGIIIGSGSIESSAVEVAKKILADVDNSLIDLSRIEIDTLINRYKGIGEAKAISIVAALELGIRMLNERNGQQAEYLNSSLSVFQYISSDIVNIDHEEFWVIYLNIRNKVIHKERISSGGLLNTSVDIRIVFRNALEKNAVALFLVHNHPSGSLIPSKEDKSLTTRIIDAGKLFSIKVLDHLIIGLDDRGEANYYSFFDNGLI